MQQLTQHRQNDKSKPCPVCSQEGIRRAVEILPDGSTLYMVAHDNGQLCKWAEGDISNVIRPKRQQGASPRVKCPRCKKPGNLGWLTNANVRPEERLFTIRYYVRHEVVPGTWGKAKKVERHRRCQSFTPEQRIAILKQVGRYIADPPRPQRDNTKKSR